MRLERTAMWCEQSLFSEQSDSKNGYIGYAKGIFTDSEISMDATMLKLGSEAQYEYGTLLCFLRSAEGHCLLKDEPAMQAYCRDRLQSHIPYAFRRECWGFRVLTDSLVFYIACTPWNEKKQVSVYVYHRDVLMTVLAKSRDLPENCYGVLPYTGERIRIRFGAVGYESFPQYGGDAAANNAFAEEANKPQKVTKAQRAAMENGVIYGWDTPAADPHNYDKDGYYMPPEENGGKAK